MNSTFSEMKGDPNVQVTVDVFACSIVNGRLCILLDQIKAPAMFRGWWKLPGAPLIEGKSTAEMVRLILGEHVDTSRIYVEQLGYFDISAQGHESRKISLVHLALVPQPDLKVDASKESHLVQWRMPGGLPKLAYDHGTIIKAGLKRLNDSLARTNIAASLLPQEFTLTELQQLYETILGRDLDIRNFRKKMLASDLIKETGHKRLTVAHRPPSLYRFVTKTKTFLDLP